MEELRSPDESMKYALQLVNNAVSQSKTWGRSPHAMRMQTPVRIPTRLSAPTTRALPSSSVRQRGKITSFVDTIHNRILAVDTFVDKETGHVQIIPKCPKIKWDPTTRWVVIDVNNKPQLAKTISTYFNTDKLGALKRQLGNYGFLEVKNIPANLQENMNGKIAFAHPTYDPTNDQTMYSLVKSKDKITAENNKSVNDLKKTIEEQTSTINDLKLSLMKADNMGRMIEQKNMHLKQLLAQKDMQIKQLMAQRDMQILFDQ